MNEYLMGLIRHVLTGGGGLLVAKGLTDDSTLEKAVAAALLLVGFIWSMLHKKGVNEIKDTGVGGSLLMLLAASLAWVGLAGRLGIIGLVGLIGLMVSAAGRLCLLLLMLALLIFPSGCTTTGAFDVDAGAAAIRNYLGPVVAYEEGADPSTIADFQLASAALGTLIQNDVTDVAAIQAKLAGLTKTPLLKLAIGEAVAAYSQYLGGAVAQGFDKVTVAKKLLQAFKDALDSGVKQQARRWSKLHRR